MERKEQMTKTYVLDTSVVVKWFSSVNEKDTEKSLQLRQAHTKNSVILTVPDLLYYELANALRYNPAFTSIDVDMAIESIFKIGIETRQVNPALIRHAIELAYKMGITVYDACFLALAQELDAVLITADYSFCKKAGTIQFLQKLSDINL